jgi:hypothetical protein
MNPAKKHVSQKHAFVDDPVARLPTKTWDVLAEHIVYRNG